MSIHSFDGLLEEDLKHFHKIKSFNTLHERFSQLMCKGKEKILDYYAFRHFLLKNELNEKFCNEYLKFNEIVNGQQFTED